MFTVTTITVLSAHLRLTIQNLSGGVRLLLSIKQPLLLFISMQYYYIVIIMYFCYYYYYAFSIIQGQIINPKLLEQIIFTELLPFVLITTITLSHHA